MLKSIDVLLGLSLVMLVASMGVTVLTQLWTAVFNTRGTHLRDGLAGLLRHLAPGFTSAAAQALMAQLLRHPLLAEGGRLGSLVHREEFTRLLLELAEGGGNRDLTPALRETLNAALRDNGIPDARAALAKIRQTALSLEVSNPEMAACARHDLAILHAAGSDFVAKINGWFDQTIERVSSRFTFTTRQVALGNAVVLAVVLHLDTVGLINRLSADDSLRGSLVQQAYAKNNLTNGIAGASKPADVMQNIEGLASRNLFPLSSGFSGWWSSWSASNIPGVMLSALLLSLGAPFWFEALKNLLRLRSAIAVKDDRQRERRQSPSPANPLPPVTF